MNALVFIVIFTVYCTLKERKEEILGQEINKGLLQYLAGANDKVYL